jgi:signal transduction histidine kinase
MKRPTALILLTLAALMPFTAAHAELKALSDAQTIVKRAAALYREKGKGAAFQAYREPAAKFTADGVFLVVIDQKGKVLYHGMKETLAGLNLMAMKDADGVMVVDTVLERAKKEGAGTLPYRWENLNTKKLEEKVMVFEAADEAVVTATITLPPK